MMSDGNRSKLLIDHGGPPAVHRLFAEHWISSLWSPYASVPQANCVAHFLLTCFLSVFCETDWRHDRFKSYVR
ncbi:hypothetical protein MPTK1_1g20830 [Marchantia polymorpha subsp. ruderalis]|uniref:Uncharacterized protein n=2 Tax=Marchantia polymorpha TaxID=3197 RepID=A0AAF6ASF1_MARPO|nr:hypothetical protein MARPO_0001s0418 [Marchantia polymorpha]BBM99371.1 hypothetical protein Mp_1g20830 [Marchantia polymorpha subsp. ruderalis]|eukprot:PTQ50452.1 hypothetical protein MARPO_0001s0418 [Marchantia polymorpha]